MLVLYIITQVLWTKWVLQRYWMGVFSHRTLLVPDIFPAEGIMIDLKTIFKSPEAEWLRRHVLFGSEPNYSKCHKESVWFWLLVAFDVMDNLLLFLSKIQSQASFELGLCWLWTNERTSCWCHAAASVHAPGSQAGFRRGRTIQWWGGGAELQGRGSYSTQSNRKWKNTKAGMTLACRHRVVIWPWVTDKRAPLEGHCGGDEVRLRGYMCTRYRIGRLSSGHVYHTA